MDKIDKIIEEKLKKYALPIDTGGDLLFKHADALKVIDKVERERAIILGVNFWKKWEGDVMEFNSTNWESINKGENASKNTIKEARELLKNGLPDDADYVCFVLRDQVSLKLKRT